ncbi:MAG: hypothetical protein AUH30_12980 [Candidatus Rokubacteria bacterium 13_1_40CM_68_15]|nr:MAG: hypothetical protein AUH30_12980 [Candidatus Rokubacteria bacterium 13_1_40CM_68_15]
MRRGALWAIAIVLLGTVTASDGQPRSLTKIRVATCARTVTTGVGAAFAVAAKMGWFEAEGLDAEIVQLASSTDCVNGVAIRQVDFALPSIEPLAILKPQGMKARAFDEINQFNVNEVIAEARAYRAK